MDNLLIKAVEYLKQGEIISDLTDTVYNPFYVKKT